MRRLGIILIVSLVILGSGCIPAMGAGDSMEVAGLTTGEVRPFFDRLKNNAAANNANALSEMIDYPLEVRLNGRLKALESPALFVKYYSCIVTDKVRRAIA